ncbi:WD40-repeat-containing domain protein [Linnemannia elongata]|nr:WD40-repeat-containing domain protein [Linnemannia elongata]
MNNYPLDQLGAHVPGKESINTVPPLRKRDKFLDLLSLPKSLFKIKAKRSTQTLKFQALNQHSTQSSVTSQVDDLQDIPLPLASDVDCLYKDTFPENVAIPAVKTTLPGLLERIERTEQLLYCNMLLPQDSVVSSSFDVGEDKVPDNPANTPQGPTLDEGEQKWLTEIKEDPMRQDRMKWLVMKMVEAFVAETTKDSTKIAEIVALGPVLQKEPYRKLLSSFIHDFDNSRILDINLLQGLVQLVQSASPGFLVSDDLVKVLSLLRTHLEGTHQQSSEHSYHLTLAVSRILDIMAEHKVQDLDRVLEHEPLSAVLSGLKDSFDPYLMYQACYAFQALQYVPDDETVLQAVLRLSTGVVDGVVKVGSVLKLDLGSVLEGLEQLQEVAINAFEIAGTVYEGVGSLMESGRGVLESLKKGLGSGQKRPWYPAVRAAYAFVQAGQLKDVKQLIYEAPCRRDSLFQWGICQLLGEIAVDSVWIVATRQQAIDLLGHLYKEDQEWGRDESVKTWMLTVLATLGSSSDGAINKYSLTLLQELDSGNSPKTQHSYPLRYCLPIPESSPILAKVQGIPYLEYELYNLRTQRLKDVNLPIYISHMAKDNLQARDNDALPLMDKLQEFLASDRQVMLILGDSGAGKSTFNKYLERQLWTEYKRGGPIPLFINLPALERPAKDLMGEQLREYNFSNEQIQELKQHRQFIVICDGYDESQLTANLHNSNSFNTSGQWNVKLVISCRSQYLGQDYHDRFVPSRGGHYNQPGVELFQEAVIAPFSTEQIKNYVEQYVPLEPRTWRTQDYMDKLTTIPNLMDLVKNPFLLSLALEALPGVIEGQQDLSTIRITRVQLYDTFVKHWSNVNKRRLQSHTLSTEDRVVFDDLLDAGFISTSIEYSTQLALAIFEKQDGNPIVQYVHHKDKDTWRAQFFGKDSEARLLRDSSPLTRTGNLHRFLHRSMLEYFLSRAIFDPSKDIFNPGKPVSDPSKFQEYDGSPQLTDPALSNAQLIDTDGPLFTRNLLTEPSVIQFLSDRVKQSTGTWFKRSLLAVIELSKSDAQAGQAAANAITILVRAGVRFNGAELQGIRIPGADLTGGQFDSAQLQDADLTSVDLSQTWIRQANLSGACMDGTRFGELPYLVELEGVLSCDISPDGKFLAAGLVNGNISIYDTATWTRIQMFQGHQGRVTSLAYSPNSQQLLSGSWDKTARLWNSETRSGDFILEGHSEVVVAVAFSPTGQQVATASLDDSIRLWDARTGAAHVLAHDINMVMGIAYSPDGTRIVSTDWDKMIRIFDVLTKLPVLMLCEDDTLQCLTYSLDGRWIVTGSYEGRLQLWEATATTLERERVWAAHASTINSVTFSPDDRWIASSSSDQTVKLWDSRSGLLLSSFVSHTDYVNCVRFSPNGSYIASASYDKSLRLWEVNAPRTGFDSHEIAYPQSCATYSPDGQQLITGSQQRSIRQLNADSGDVDYVFPDHLYNITCVAFSPDGLHLAIGGGSESEVILWSVESRAASFVLNGHKTRVNCLAFSPCGHWLSSGGYDPEVRLWDARSGEAVDILIGHKGVVESVAFSPDGRWIASACGKGIVLLWETGTGELKAGKSIDAGLHKLNVVAYKPGCLQVASCHGDGSIRLWDDDQQLQGFRYILNQDLRIHRFAFSSCGQWVATTHETCVRLWKLSSPDQDQRAFPLQDQDCVSVIEEFTRAAGYVIWKPNRLEFATASYEGSICAWRVVEDTNGSGRVSVRLLWSSGPATLAASGALLHDTVGLSTMNRKLLELRGAIGSSTN